MSAFLMNLDGFEQLANEFAARLIPSDNLLQWQIQRFLGVNRFHDSIEKIESASREKVTQLYEANIEAVNIRYPESETDLPLVLNFKVGLVKWSNVQLYKYLSCLEYQMSEGKVYDSQIRKDLSILVDSIGRSLLEETQEYKKAAYCW